MSHRAAFTLCLVLGLQASALGNPAGQDPLQLEVRSWCEPEVVAIGEPFTLAIDVEHPAGGRVTFEVEDLDLPDTWWIEEPRRVVSLALDDEPGRKFSRARWRLAGIEPGEHALPLGGLVYHIDGMRNTREVPAALITLRGELAEGEDLPRSLAGFHEPPTGGKTSLPWRWVFYPLFGMLIGLILWGLRRSKEIVESRGPSPLQSLSALDPCDETMQRQSFFVLSRAVRETFDRELGAQLDGLTDEEWIEANDDWAGDGNARFERAALFLRSCERVKYGAETPTRWAVEEALKEARELCESSTGGEA